MLGKFPSALKKPATIITTNTLKMAVFHTQPKAAEIAEQQRLAAEYVIKKNMAEAQEYAERHKISLGKQPIAQRG